MLDTGEAVPVDTAADLLANEQMKAHYLVSTCTSRRRDSVAKPSQWLSRAESASRGDYEQNESTSLWHHRSW